MLSAHSCKYLSSVSEFQLYKSVEGQFNHLVDTTGCLLIVEWLFLAVPWVCLQFVIVVFPDHTHLLFFIQGSLRKNSKTFQRLLKTILQFPRAKRLGKILIEVLKFFFKNARLR